MTRLLVVALSPPAVEHTVEELEVVDDIVTKIFSQLVFLFYLLPSMIPRLARIRKGVSLLKRSNTTPPNGGPTLQKF